MRPDPQPHQLGPEELAEYFQQEAEITASEQRRANRMRLRYYLAITIVWLAGCALAANELANAQLSRQAQAPVVLVP